MNDERLLRVSVGEIMKTDWCIQSGWIQSANYVRTELPVRIAHRLRDLQALPYIVVTREGVAKVYEVRASFIVLGIELKPLSVCQLYWSAFEKYVCFLRVLIPILINYPEFAATLQSLALKKMNDFVTFSRVSWTNSWAAFLDVLVSNLWDLQCPGHSESITWTIAVFSSFTSW